MPLPNRKAVCYGEDVTIADVEGIQSFLVARTDPLSSAHRGSIERHVARGVRVALLQLVGTLQHSLSFLDPDSLSEAELLQLHLQITLPWNTLWALVSPWQWRDDYDHERWRHVKYWNVGQKDEFEERLAIEFSKDRRRSASKGGTQ
ncbi:hypothetical protein AB0M92_27505 [Streptomyces sp. NPDC051582]|uniref:hypothetical protein n=1 Tax=Streptomyces sp. NPDC051582 TaxID=3155167 RepID=UPI0034439B36